MPIPSFHELIEGVRSISRRGDPEPLIQNVHIDPSGAVTLVWNPANRMSAVGRRLAERANVESILTSIARGERQVTAAERQLPFYRDALPFIDDFLRSGGAAPGGGGDEPFPRADFDLPQVAGEQESPIGREDYFVPRFVRGFHRSIPGGAAGMAQQTPATLTRIGGAIRGGGGGRRRRRAASKPRRSARRVRRAGVRRAGRRNHRLVKGSAAAKRHMAKLRRMRKR